MKAFPTISVATPPAVLYFRVFDVAATTAPVGVDPFLVEWRPVAGAKPLIMRPGTTEGYALRCNINNSSPPGGAVSSDVTVATWIEFTEA